MGMSRCQSRYISKATFQALPGSLQKPCSEQKKPSVPRGHPERMEGVGLRFANPTYTALRRATRPASDEPFRVVPLFCSRGRRYLSLHPFCSKL